ncbi:MAG: outer membrane beta-barrel protein, partial [Enhygromyxa sp.]
LPFWIHVGLHAGAAADAVYGGEPTPGGVDSQFSGVDVFKHVSLANAGVKLASGTDLGGGVFLSPVGFGSMFTTDTWLYTNAWESNSTPYYLMGGRIGQDLPAGFRVEGWVVNGFQTIADANGAPSYMVSLYWTRNNLSLGQHVFFGPEQARMQPRGWLVHSDTQLVWNTPRVGVAGLWDVGQERSLDSTNPGVAVWTGGQASLRVAAVLREKLRLDFVARPEMWWDNRGRLSGNEGFLVSATGGMVLWAFDDSIGLRLEYRYDWTSDPNGYFYRRGATNPAAVGLAGDQHNVILALTGKFDYQLPRLLER